MSAMDLTRFESLLEAHGGDPARWPADERAAAEALLARSAAARAARDEARALDAALARVTAPPPSQALLEAVLAAAPRRDEAPAPARPERAGRLAGVGLAAGALAAWRAGLARVSPRLAPGPILGGALSLGLAAGLLLPGQGSAPGDGFGGDAAEAYLASLFAEDGFDFPEADE